MLLDLIFYEHRPLVSEALNLLVRHFEQKRVLQQSLTKVQILIKPNMVRMFGEFDSLLADLNRLAARRRLFDNEIYQATKLMSDLLTYVYEPDEASASGAATPRGGDERLATDHTVGVFRHLVGKGKSTVGESTIDMVPPASRRSSVQAKGIAAADRLVDGMRIYIDGKAYNVLNVAGGNFKVTLDKPVVVDPVIRRGVQPGAQLEVFVFCHCKSPGPDKDMQLLLRNMQAHKGVTALLNLPFNKEMVLQDELPIRELMLMAYRLLKALTLGFPQMQADLSHHLDLFLTHTGSSLVAFDISPTGCINAVCQDNRDACVQLGDDTIHRFIEMAAESHEPRFVRFLRMVVDPQGRPIKRNQEVVLGKLSEVDNALLLFNDAEARGRMKSLFLAEDHLKNPRGELIYHTELINLLGACAYGKNAANEMRVRDLVDITAVSHMLIEQVAAPPARTRPLPPTRRCGRIPRLLDAPEPHAQIAPALGDSPRPPRSPSAPVLSRPCHPRCASRTSTSTRRRTS